MKYLKVIFARIRLKIVLKTATDNNILLCIIFFLSELDQYKAT